MNLLEVLLVCKFINFHRIKKYKKMKKLFLTGAVMLAMIMASCGGSKSENAKESVNDTVAFEEVDIIEVDGVAVDTVQAEAAADSEDGQSLIEKLKNSKAGAEAVALAGQAKDYIVKLVSSGKIDEAKAYFAKISPYIKEKAPKVYESIKSVFDDNDNLKTVKEKASETMDAAKAKGSEMKDAAKEKVSDLKDKAKGLFSE